LGDSSGDETSDLSPPLQTYLAALHDIISAYHQRLTEITSPQVANQFLGNMSDLAMKHLGFDIGKSTPIESAQILMGNLGMKLDIVKVGDKFDCKLECPFAKQVHPHLASEHSICPVTILVLGALRVNERHLIPTKISLTETGTRTVIEKNAQM
jgi:hypothetical protein